MIKQIKIIMFGFFLSISLVIAFANSDQLMFKQIGCSIQSNKNKYQDLFLEDILDLPRDIIW